MERLINHVIQQPTGKPILIDLIWKKNQVKKPIIIFCHGYKGYKDWGAWNLMINVFAKSDFVVMKFNFSHNGGTIDQPIDFPDLEAFGNNTYTQELEDLDNVLDWISLSTDIPENEIDKKNIILMGHSRGGGVAIIKASEDDRITKLITLASISDIGARFPTDEALNQWKEKGVRYILNGRTKQSMPHYFSFYEDYENNNVRLDIKKSAITIKKKPWLIIHGEQDEAVKITEAQSLHHWNPNSILKVIPQAGHTFGSKHPWTEKSLPEDLKKAVKLCVDFSKI